MAQFTNVVYLMLENRSLDNVLGWLYQNTNPLNIVGADLSPVFNGLQTGQYTNSYNTGDGIDMNCPANQVTQGNWTVPDVDPHEEYSHVNTQLFQSSDNPLENQQASMAGFCTDFSTTDTDDVSYIMDCFTPDSLPVINGLAQGFAVSDAYFSSVPTQTNCNRAFAASGNSIGVLSNQVTAMVNNQYNYYDPYDPVSFSGPTIWDVLVTNGYNAPDDWMIFYSDLWATEYCFTQDIFPGLEAYGAYWDGPNNPKIVDISNFFSQAQNGTLPTFSFLEPSWIDATSNGNDYHPPANLYDGEAFLNEVYNALVNSPQWNNILFIVNFDEHGGTYDHVPPPWGASQPWANPSDGTNVPAACEGGFGFDRFGVRVPLLLISPYIPESTVFRSDTHIPLDHTSVIATVLNLFNIEKSTWGLGSRVANAPTLEQIPSLSQPRSTDDIPAIILPEQSSGFATADVKPNDLQMMIAQRVLSKAAKRSKMPKEEFKNLYFEHFADIKTARELRQVTEEMLKIIPENK